MQIELKQTIEQAIGYACFIENAINIASDDAKKHGAKTSTTSLRKAQIALENLRESLEQLIYHEKIGLL